MISEKPLPLSASAFIRNDLSGSLPTGARRRGLQRERRLRVRRTTVNKLHLFDVKHLLARLGSKIDTYAVTKNGMTHAIVPPLHYRSLVCVRAYTLHRFFVCEA
ncbi:hypothetical protein EVAR_92055_1 [Eumeta japonica]|uniref:Uncharacterized protein n=1 Tax=Eumeta variegata TaxID=151549 RepID=A0A4C1SYY9_EUMVA|nr:hypothetical protein EVAR_92055_1 [Eumeta japonica]